MNGFQTETTYLQGLLFLYQARNLQLLNEEVKKIFYFGCK